MGRQKNILQMKEQEKTPEENPNETQLSNLPDKEFKATVTTIFNELEHRIEELREHLNRDRKCNKEPI